ncbi:hypothetical protein TPHA_0P00630 [Tetrapisispora phaffii CBS 4417]|uniref:CNNM transmembrane domain-containing protein n=1 Tax=Tetrapisispora phaffii (strain ATCC 24235 / CBS 4417 / NBRC 1672 / NRRL Y-8282 / UCD 70-5) TaxID=1071381 RepID=G8C243_TETPH|nr:hypothetical protein TPHA_0P00630 [Tetrapisispora phaffii CBS 4417]CCE66221.1 hypothetical protein TPHA_0P00630 [Tetrapisispora phaffii CBS 4417]
MYLYKLRCFVVVSCHLLLPKVALALPLVKDLSASAVVTETSPQLYLVISIGLVLLGGIFAGLTLALMGQDEIYLKVIQTSGSPRERQLASSVLDLLAMGKHQILVTLLLSNVITNETLPIVLDRFIGKNGGGWQAVLFSTVLIVIFGEIIPQSICVKYGLQIGSVLSPYVRLLIYLLYPISYPIAKLLDHILGEDHGTMYKKSGLKTLVNLHQTNGIERLTRDEVTIISAVLDLKDKKVSEIMTPIDKVFTLSSATVLDEDTVNVILNSGFSRIPIYLPNDPNNFIGMLLVKILISYDPEDSLRLSEFPLATLPETLPNTSSLNILNYFQQGKSHMCLVSEKPGESSGALGILTLEDVIEELIGEEIVDESDVYAEQELRNENNFISLNSPLLKSKFRTNTTSYSSLPKFTDRTAAANEVAQRQGLLLKKTSSSKTPVQDGVINHAAHNKLPSNMASNPLKDEPSFVKIKRNIPFGMINGIQSNENINKKSNSLASIHSTKTANTGNDSNISPIMINQSSSNSKFSNKNTIENNNGIVESVITVKGVPKTIIQSTDMDSSQDMEGIGGLLLVHDKSLLQNQNRKQHSSSENEN